MNSRDNRSRHVRRADQLAEKGQWDRAAVEYARWLQQSPDDAVVRYNLGVCQQQLGQLGDAERTYRDVLRGIPYHIGALTNLGNLLLAQGETAAALIELSKVAEHHPQLAAAHFNLGTATFRHGDYRGATRCFERATALEPNHFETWGQLGLCYASQGIWFHACDAYGRAVALRPNDPVALCNLALAQRQANRTTEADATCQRVVEAVRQVMTLPKGQHSFYGTLASRLYENGWRQAAIDVIDVGLARLPDDKSLQHLRAGISLENVPARAADEYVKQVFGPDAASYDSAMHRLGYRGPEQIQQALRECVPAGQRVARALDLGCGTGLCGAVIRDVAEWVAGVDLSAPMLEVARQRDAYHVLWEAELTSCLVQHVDEFDLIVAADTLVYFGEIGDVLRGAARAMRPGGHFIFTVEQAPDSAASRGFTLQSHGRYNHHADYLDRSVRDCGMVLRQRRSILLRNEGDQPVPGWLVIASLT